MARLRTSRACERQRAGSKTKENYVKFIAVFLVVFAISLISYTGVSYISDKGKIESQLSEIKALEKQLALEKKRGLKLDREEKAKNTDEYIERVARETLGLVKPNDIILQVEK